MVLDKKDKKDFSVFEIPSQESFNLKHDTCTCHCTENLLDVTEILNPVS